MSESKCSYRIAYEKQKKRAERAEAENAEFRLANQVMHGAYLRIRKLLSAWNTPTAPTTEQVHEYVEDCVRAIVNENAAAQSTIADLQATVERLDKERIELAKMLLHYVRSVPLGNQPHMSAEIAEKMALVALGDAS